MYNTCSHLVYLEHSPRVRTAIPANWQEETLGFQMGDQVYPFSIPGSKKTSTFAESALLGRSPWNHREVPDVPLKSQGSASCPLLQKKVCPVKRVTVGSKGSTESLGQADISWAFGSLKKEQQFLKLKPTHIYIKNMKKLVFHTNNWSQCMLWGRRRLSKWLLILPLHRKPKSNKPSVWLILSVISLL